MSKAKTSTRTMHVMLTPRERLACAILALLLAAVTLWYLAWPREVRAAAPECMAGTDCTVLISAPVDSVTVAAFLLLTFLCALMAISGIVFTPKIGDSELTPLTVETVEEIPHDATRIVAARLTAPSVQKKDADSPGQMPLGPVQSRVLWDTLPQELQQAVTSFATDDLRLSPAEIPLGIREIAVHSDGSGAGHPYYVRLEAHGKKKILKLF
ncbi:MAG: hypothetical protein L0H74_10360 [Brachybacterium sp.]|nr:hypothetical protein [Brachybacterium sp.]